MSKRKEREALVKRNRDAIWAAIEALVALGLPGDAHNLRVIYDTHCRPEWRN